MACISKEVQGSEHQVPRKENVIWNKNSISCKGLKYLAILILEISSAAADGLVEMMFAGTANGDQGLGVCVCVSRLLRPRYFYLGGAFQWNVRERD
jgi:hypothetical protein